MNLIAPNNFIKIALLVLLAAPFSATAKADERTKSTHYAGGFFGQGQLILGSEDSRYGGGFFYAWGRPEPKFRWGSVPAQAVFEAYADHTHSTGASGNPGNDTWGYGVLAYGRWRWPISHNGWGAYGDFGLGLQYASHSTVDLDSMWNTTPMGGLGVARQFGSQEFLVGVRLLHISNAGTVGHNQGQNQLFLTLGIRFK